MNVERVGATRQRFDPRLAVFARTATLHPRPSVAGTVLGFAGVGWLVVCIVACMTVANLSAWTLANFYPLTAAACQAVVWTSVMIIPGLIVLGLWQAARHRIGSSTLGLILAVNLMAAALVMVMVFLGSG